MSSERELYGGAGKCLVPNDWIDASTLRQIPDHQEVFVSESGEQSVIIEILDYEGEVKDEGAGQYFYQDLANADSAESWIVEEKTQSEGMMFGEKVLRVDIHGVQVKSKTAPNSPSEPVYVYMTLFRAPKLLSDILITSHSLTRGGDVHKNIAVSVEFIDIDLFQC